MSSTGNKGNNMVDKGVDKGLTTIVKLLANKHSQADISRKLGMSRQAISKKVKRLIDKGFIEESPESTPTHKFYTVNQILTMSEERLTQDRYHLIFDPHNYAIKFRVVPGGRGNFPKDHKLTKRHWDTLYLDHNQVEFELTTKHLIGTMKNRISFNLYSENDIEGVKAMIHSIIVQEAEEVIKKYGMEVDLNHPIMSRKELKIIDPKIKPSMVHFHDDKNDFKKVYSDNSVEFRNEVHARNFVANRIMENGSDDIKEMISEVRNELHGSVATMNAISNTQMMIAGLLKTLMKRTGTKAGPVKVVQDSLWRFCR